MDIRIDDDSVRLHMTRDEAKRLGFALQIGCERNSRAEYWIVTGVSQLVVREIAAALIDTEAATIDLAPGVEEIENPRRPRPPA